MRWVILALVSTTAGIGTYYAWPALCERSNGPARASAASAGLDDEDAPRIFASGTVEGSQREISLRFELEGRLKEIHVRPGDHVEKGDVLAELDADLWEQKFAEAGTMLKLARAERDRLVNGASEELREATRARLRNTELQVRELESQWARSRQTARQDGVVPKDIDELRARYERATAQLPALRAKIEELEMPLRKEDLTIAESKVALAEGALRRERILLDKTLLRAPSDGLVLRVLGEPGEVVGPHDPRELLSLVNRNQTRVRAYVEELDALSVHPGQPATVSADGRPDIRYDGIVQSCAPYVGPKLQRHMKPGEFVDIRVREVLIELSGGGDLLIGLPVDVFIVLQSDESPASPPAVARRHSEPKP